MKSSTRPCIQRAIHKQDDRTLRDISKKLIKSSKIIHRIKTELNAGIFFLFLSFLEM